MLIENKLEIWKDKLSKSEKIAFLSAFICGMIAHLYIYSNTIPNFDGISRVYDEQQVTLLGRWFLHYASYQYSFTQMPMVIGVLAMGFLAYSALVTVHLLRIKSSLLAGLWGLVSVVFPPVAYTNTFTYTVSAYCFAIALAVTGVWVTHRWKWGFLGGSILLALSMGTYQVYVTTAITLCILLVMQKFLDKRNKIPDILRYATKHVVFLAAGALLYYAVLKIFLKAKNLELSPYLGMASVEQGYPLDQLGAILVNTYRQVLEFLFQDKGYTTRVLICSNILLVIISVILLAIKVTRETIWNNPINLSGILLLPCLLPAAVNFGQILSPYSAPSSLMQYSYVYLLLVPIMLIDEGISYALKSRLQEILAIISVCGVLIISVSYWEYDNVVYTMLNQAHRSTLSFVTTVVSRIESHEGYQTGMDVVIVGGFPANRYGSDIPVYDRVKTGSILQESVIPLNKHIYYYMNDWLNIPIKEPEEQVFLEVSESETFRAMPLYPDYGSIKIIDGRLVVKMQETFSPKTPYEKAYEQRR